MMPKLSTRKARVRYIDRVQYGNYQALHRRNLDKNILAFAASTVTFSVSNRSIEEVQQNSTQLRFDFENYHAIAMLF